MSKRRATKLPLLKVLYRKMSQETAKFSAQTAEESTPVVALSFDKPEYYRAKEEFKLGYDAIPPPVRGNYISIACHTPSGEA